MIVLQTGDEKPDEVHRPLNNNHDDPEKQSIATTEEEDDDDDDEDKVTLREYLMSIVFMPRSMQILCFTNLLSWMAHLSYSLYFTDFVGEAVFLGDPTV